MLRADRFLRIILAGALAAGVAACADGNFDDPEFADSQLEVTLANYPPITATLDVTGTTCLFTDLDHAAPGPDQKTVAMVGLEIRQPNLAVGPHEGTVVKGLGAAANGETARRSDHVGRVGGEEFLIVAPNCDLNVLQECAERFRSAIGDRPFETTSGALPITVSIGATIWSADHPLSSEHIRKMADYALYRVKSRGRNGVNIVPHPDTVSSEQLKKTG